MLPNLFGEVVTTKLWGKAYGDHHLIRSVQSKPDLRNRRTSPV